MRPTRREAAASAATGRRADASGARQTCSAGRRREGWCRCRPKVSLARGMTTPASRRNSHGYAHGGGRRGGSGECQPDDRRVRSSRWLARPRSRSRRPGTCAGCPARWRVIRAPRVTVASRRWRVVPRVAMRRQERAPTPGPGIRPRRSTRSTSRLASSGAGLGHGSPGKSRRGPGSSSRPRSVLVCDRRGRVGRRGRSWWPQSRHVLLAVSSRSRAGHRNSDPAPLRSTPARTRSQAGAVRGERLDVDGHRVVDATRQTIVCQYARRDGIQGLAGTGGDAPGSRRRTASCPCPRPSRQPRCRRRWSRP